MFTLYMCVPFNLLFHLHFLFFFLLKDLQFLPAPSWQILYQI
ncbi:unnamed protein product [Brassica oleracea]